MKAGRLTFDGAALGVESRVANPRIARHPAAQARDRKTALPVLVRFGTQRCQYRIHDFGIENGLGVGIALVVLETKDHDSQRNADLRCSESGAGRSKHGFAHVGDQCLELRRPQLLNRLRALKESRITHPQNRVNHPISFTT